MKDRERLIELLVNFNPYKDPIRAKADRMIIEKNADYLLANGVIVPPCKVGDKVYVISRYYTGFWEVYECEISELSIYKNNTFIRCEKGRKFSFGLNIGEIGKTVFLTKEEAEQKLKELGK